MTGNSGGDLSVCLSTVEPANLSWLSEQTGVSESTIKKPYGRFMHHPERDAIELRKIRPPSLPEDVREPIVRADTDPPTTSPRAARRPRRAVRGSSGRRVSGT